MKIKLSKLLSWLYPIQLEKVQGELGHQLEINAHNGKLVLDTATVNYSYGSLQEVFDQAFKKTGLYERELHSVLIPGFGSGCVSQLLHEKCDPDIEVVGIEADREVIRLAKKYFPEANSSHVKIIHSDAAEYVRNVPGNFDLVVVDVFVNNQVPLACQSVDFFADVKSHLNMQGKIYVNKMFTGNEDADAQLEVNLRTVFRDVKVVKVPRTGSVNHVYVGTRKRKLFA